MFLDDKLLEMCKNAECDTPDKIQQLNVDLCKECEDYYKSKLSPSISNREAKSVLDRTFNLFDSFVRMAIKSDDGKLQALGKLFQNYSFKKQFLFNKEINDVYNSF